MTALVYAVEAHRGRGTVHLARPHETPARFRVSTPGEVVLATSALCGASTAAGIRNGSRLPRRLRPGVDVAQTPTCFRCLGDEQRPPFPTPDRPIPGGTS